MVEKIVGVSGVEINKVADLEKIKEKTKMKGEEKRKSPEEIAKNPHYKYINDAEIAIMRILNNATRISGGLPELYVSVDEVRKKDWITDEVNYLYQILSKEELLLQMNQDVIDELMRCNECLADEIDVLKVRQKDVIESEYIGWKRKFTTMFLFNLCRSFGATEENKKKHPMQKGLSFIRACTFFDKNTIPEELIKDILERSGKFAKIDLLYFAKGGTYE